MNFIGIDISINSTAIFIESKKGINILSFTNKKDNNIYIKELDRYGVKFHFLEHNKSKDYSKNEILKINDYNKISDNIINEIIKYIDLNEKTYCNIEGYSFSKNTSSILDIVAFSTLIKCKLLLNIKDIDMSIISPSTLKLETCKIVYEPIDIGIKKPKLVYINKNGVAGGSFKKPDMYQAILDGNIKTPIFEMLKTYKHLLERDKIPNPIEDIIDATFACKIKKMEISKYI